MLDTMCEVMKAAYDRGWISTLDGNVSLHRRNTNSLYITPTAVRKQNLTSDGILKMSFPLDRDQPEGWAKMTRVDDEYQRRLIGLRPSGELPMHYLLQKKIDTSNRVVVHLHATHIVAAMYAGYDLREIVAEFPEVALHTRIGESVPPVKAQSVDLGQSVYEAFGANEDGSLSYDLVGIDRHGCTAVGIDPWKAYSHIERVNHICEIVLAAGGLKSKIFGVR